MFPTSTILHWHPATPGSPAERGSQARKLHHSKPHLTRARFVEPTPTTGPADQQSRRCIFTAPRGWLLSDTRKNMDTSSQRSSSGEFPQAKLEHGGPSLAEMEPWLLTQGASGPACWVQRVPQACYWVGLGWWSRGAVSISPPQLWPVLYAKVPYTVSFNKQVV